MAAARAALVAALLLCSWWSLWASWRRHRAETPPPPPANWTPGVAARRRQDVPRYMMDLYRRQAAAEIVRSLTPRGSAPMDLSTATWRDGPHLLVFDAPPAGPGEALVGAELRLMAVHDGGRYDEGRGRSEILVRVHLLDDDAGMLELDRRPVRRGPWVGLNVTAALLRGGGAPLAGEVRLVVSASRGGRLRWGHARPAPLSADEKPLLLLSYATAPGQVPRPRTKRSPAAPDDYEEETNHVWDDDVAQGAATPRRPRRPHRNTCRRRPLYVDFAEIHYDTWIVAPSGYEAFQCVGKCFFPISEHLTPTKHAIVQTLLHSVSPGRVSRACCVPTKLEPISVLYVDHRGVLTYRFSYQDMVVAECGCR